MVMEDSSTLLHPSQQTDNEIATLLANMEEKILENTLALINPLTEQFAEFKLTLNKVSQTADCAKDLSLMLQGEAGWCENFN
ncbi:UNVERIFIED_CONTAM: hypothetical protein K2H54_037099 [Gekko kuhli]